MTWWGWLLLVTYLTGWVVATRRIGYLMAYEYGEPDGSDIAAGLFFGGLCAFAWPALFPLYRWYRYAKEHQISGAGLLSAPRHIRRETEMRRREREMLDRERRIRSMERELGVGQR